MPTVSSVLTELKSKSTEKARITYGRHGVPIDRSYGVSFADLKIIAKPLKKQQSLALELYDSRIFEAMYLAGMIADGSLMSESQVQSWAEQAENMPPIAEHTVAWVTVDHPIALALAIEWIRSPKENLQSSGWCALSGLAATKPDPQLDLPEFENLLTYVVKNIHQAKNRARYTMNGFVIAVGTYVLPLFKEAKTAATQIGSVSVDMGDTACRVPLATEYIAKVEALKRIGQKRKTIRC